jgi:hypothetical protein
LVARRIDADLLEHVVGDIAERPDRGEVCRVDDHRLLVEVAGCVDHFAGRLEVSLLDRQIDLDAIC